MTNSGPFKLPLISRGSFRTLATQSNAEGASGWSFEPGPWVAPPTTENCKTENDFREITIDAGRQARRQCPRGEVHPGNIFCAGRPTPRCLPGFPFFAK